MKHSWQDMMLFLQCIHNNYKFTWTGSHQAMTSNLWRYTVLGKTWKAKWDGSYYQQRRSNSTKLPRKGMDGDIPNIRYLVTTASKIHIGFSKTQRHHMLYARKTNAQASPWCHASGTHISGTQIHQNLVSCKRQM